MKIRRPQVLAALALCLIALLAPLAQARSAAKVNALQGPAREKYSCADVSNPPESPEAGSIVLLAKGRYRYSRSYDQSQGYRTGRYSFSATAVRFLSGPLQGAAGPYRREKAGYHFMDLKFPPRHGAHATWYCVCVPHQVEDIE